MEPNGLIAPGTARCRCTAAPKGPGCHDVLFDLWAAALAVRERPEEQRAPCRALLAESLMLLRSQEGGFRVTPIPSA